MGAGPDYLGAALAVERQGAAFAGVEGAGVRYSSGVHSDLQVCVGRASGDGSLRGVSFLFDVFYLTMYVYVCL